MSKNKSSYICNSCNEVFHKWSGQCLSCKEWDSIAEVKQDFAKKKGTEISFRELGDNQNSHDRINTNIGEFDRVVGGGIVNGSVTLIGGDPGVGKSTLILQILNALNGKDIEAIYFTGEESINQINNRAKRIGLENKEIKISTDTEVNEILAFLSKNRNIKLVIIDSIQTTYISELPATPGSTNQLRNSTLKFSEFAKKNDITFILIGHVTKDGQIAGPKLVEHMVDTVLYFEGEKNSNLRILKSHKNRYGPTNELAIFEMVEKGLKQVTNPSEIFIEAHKPNVSGSSIFPLKEGSRTILLELQALVANSYMASPRRTVVGWDQNRLAIILAILASRAGLNFSQLEVYFSVAGGLKISEPAADLAVAAALISALNDKILPEKTIFFGEIGLSGEVRSVVDSQQRIDEAKRLGFERVFMPKMKKGLIDVKDLKIIFIEHIRELRDLING